MAQWQKNDPEKVSYMQKTKPKATNKTRKERLKSYIDCHLTNAQQLLSLFGD